MKIINYQKIKRRFETSAANINNTPLINSVVNYSYDSSGDPVRATLTANSQDISDVFISRDKYNRTTVIQYSGFIKGIFQRVSETNRYNIKKDIFKLTHNPIELSKITNDILFEKKGIIVPLYFYNESQYELTISTEKHKSVDQYYILNIENGPGDSNRNELIFNYIDLLNQRNKTPVGYVYTQHGNRDIEEVVNDIRLWAVLYPNLKGFFIDEVRNSSETYYVNYYSKIHDFIKNLDTSYTIIGNPGTIVEYRKYYEQIFDYVIIYEGSLNNIDEQTSLAIKEISHTVSNTGVIITDYVYDQNNPTVRPLNEIIEEYSDVRLWYFHDSNIYNKLSDYYLKLNMYLSDFTRLSGTKYII